MNTIRLNVLGEAKAAAPGVSIKNQDKSVDIAENGVTEVTADSGYTGLGKVTINANVQGGEKDSTEYLDVSKLDSNNRTMLVWAAQSVRIIPPDYGAELAGIPAYMAANTFTSDVAGCTSAVAIDFSYKLVAKMGDTFQEMTLLQQLSQNGLSQEEIDAIPRITKEEFYTL